MIGNIYTDTMASACIDNYFLYKYINSRIKFEGVNNEKNYKPFDCIFIGVGGGCLELF
jgi:hypothetical protein